MESRAKLAGHAIHPMLITLPPVLLAALAAGRIRSTSTRACGQDS
jgi:hypothetical protein